MSAPRLFVYHFGVVGEMIGFDRDVYMPLASEGVCPACRMDHLLGLNKERSAALEPGLRITLPGETEPRVWASCRKGSSWLVASDVTIPTLPRQMMMRLPEEGEAPVIEHLENGVVVEPGPPEIPF